MFTHQRKGSLLEFLDQFQWLRVITKFGGALINLNVGVSLRLLFLLVDQSATLGIRPEHVGFDTDSADNLIYAVPSAFEILGKLPW